MTRREAARLIQSHGGFYTRNISPKTSLVVVGRDGWPLASDGRPAPKLRRALALARQGRSVEVIPEEEFLSRLGCSPGRLQRHFTLRELSQMLSIPLARLEVWLRSGLISPSSQSDGIRYFDFQHVAGVRSLCELVRSGITTARLRQSLSRLRCWLGDLDDPLSQLMLLESSRQLVVRLNNGQIAEPHGQLLFAFDAEPAEPAPAVVPWTADQRSATEWFQIGCQAEQREDFQQAVDAYRQALLMGGPSAEVCFNLANVLCSLGDYARASERYRQVLELDPSFWEAWNNLGTVLTYDGENEAAIAAYRRALKLHPHYADAHYNLADTLEDLGRTDDAIEHWRAYLDLEPRGAGAKYALERLHTLL
jgi:tetratricopeptide (TPR) repeat protein